MTNNRIAARNKTHTDTHMGHGHGTNTWICFETVSRTTADGEDDVGDCKSMYEIAISHDGKQEQWHANTLPARTARHL